MTIKSELTDLMHNRELTNKRYIESWARTNKDSCLHKDLKYDNPEGAAHEWRLTRIGQHIAVLLVESPRLAKYAQTDPTI